MGAPVYIQLTLIMDPMLPAREIAVAWLETCGFDMFEESSNGLMAYGKESEVDEEAKNQILDELSKLTDLKADVERLTSKNWNAVWESDYEPIDVDGMAMMRAPISCSAVQRIGFDYPTSNVIWNGPSSNNMANATQSS